MIQKDLQKLGFTKNLSNVYLTLFELGEAKAGEIVRRTGLHRNLVYTALEKLEEKKLVTKSKSRGVARFSALDPTRIMGEVDEKKKLAEQIIEELKSKRQVKSQEIVIYEGKAEMVRKYREFYTNLEENDTWDVIGLSPSFFEIHTKKDIEDLAAVQNEKKFRIRGISGYIDPQEDDYVASTNGLTEFKLVPTISKKENEIEVLKDRVLIFIFTEPYTLIEIFNDDLVAGYKEYFDLLWNQQTQTFVGTSGVQHFLADTLRESDVYWIGGNGGMQEYYPDIWEEYRNKRVENKVFWHDLVDPNMVLRGSGDHAHISEDLYYESRVLPPSVASPHVVCIYGNKVANIVWKEESIVTITEDIDVAASQRRYFDYLWNQEVQTYAGWHEIEQLYMEELLPSLKKGDTEYVIGANPGRTKASADRIMKLFTQFHKKRREEGAFLQAIFNERDRLFAEEEFSASGDTDAGTHEIKFLPGKYWSPLGIDIFPDKAVVFMMGDEPTATVYNNPDVIAGFKKQFDALWGQEVQTYSGWDEVETFFLEDYATGLADGDIEYVIGGGYGEKDQNDRLTQLFLKHNAQLLDTRMEKHSLFYEQYRERFKNEVNEIGGSAESNMYTRYLPDEFHSPVEIHVFKNKCSVSYFGAHPVTTVYSNPGVIAGFKSQFDMLWSSAEE